MKYSLQCKYSMINQVFLFVVKSMQKDNDYSFQWQIQNVDKPIWFLTNNNILFKAQTIQDLVYFSLQTSDKDINVKNIQTSRLPTISFETEQQQLEIIYDFNKKPNRADLIVGKILSKVIYSYGGGFLQSQQEYIKLQEEIKKSLLNEGLLTQQDLQYDDQKIKKIQQISVEPKNVTRKRKTTSKTVSEKSKKTTRAKKEGK